MKTLSVRATATIISLFEEIKAIELNQKNDRNTILSRALNLTFERISIKNTAGIDWREISNIKLSKMECYVPENIRLTISEEKKYLSVLENIQIFYDLKRVVASFLVKLVLSYYLSEIQKRDNHNYYETSLNTIAFGADYIAFKNAFKSSDFATPEQKNVLLKLTRKYLKEFNPALNEKIKKEIHDKIIAYSDFFNINSIYPRPRSDYGQVNIVFTSKVLAGLLLTCAEIEGHEIDKVINELSLVINK